MTLDEAMNDGARVSVGEAYVELKRHGVEARLTVVGARYVLVTEDGERIARVGADGDLAARDVLAWLGY